MTEGVRQRAAAETAQHAPRPRLDEGVDAAVRDRVQGVRPAHRLRELSAELLLGLGAAADPGRRHVRQGGWQRIGEVDLIQVIRAALPRCGLDPVAAARARSEPPCISRPVVLGTTCGARVLCPRRRTSSMCRRQSIDAQSKSSRSGLFTGAEAAGADEAGPPANCMVSNMPLGSINIVQRLCTDSPRLTSAPLWVRTVHPNPDGCAFRLWLLGLSFSRGELRLPPRPLAPGTESEVIKISCCLDGCVPSAGL